MISEKVEEVYNQLQSLIEEVETEGKDKTYQKLRDQTPIKAVFLLYLNNTERVLINSVLDGKFNKHKLEEELDELFQEKVRYSHEWFFPNLVSILKKNECQEHLKAKITELFQ